MNKLYTLVALIVLLLSGSCTDDKGSYNYAPENKISIHGLKEVYTVTAHESFNPALAPELDFALHDKQNLSYSWMIDYKEVCNHPTLDVPIDVTVGQHTAQLVITDNETALKYYYEFTIHVETPYSAGLAVLSALEDGTAKLSFQQREATGVLHEFQTEVFEENNPAWGTLGTTPIAMTMQTDAGTEDYKNTTYCLVLCGGGEKYLSVLDLNTMQLQRAFLAADIVDCPSPWQPRQMDTGVAETLILANGRMFTYDMISCGRISTPLELEGHSLGWISLGGHFRTSIVPAYDEATHQFVYFRKQAGRDFTFDEIHAFNEMEESAQNEPIYLTGLTMMAGEKMFNDGGLHYSYSAGWMTEKVDDDTEVGASTLRFIFKDSEGKAHFYTYDFEVGEFLNEWDYTYYVKALGSYGVKEDRVISGLILDDHTVIKALPYSKYWLIANKRDVIREFYMDGTERMSFSLPAEVKGDIVLMQPSKDETKLFVAVYDSAAEGNFKGGIAVIGLDTKQGTFGKLLEYYPGVCGKAVSMIERISAAASND